MSKDISNNSLNYDNGGVNWSFENANCVTPPQDPRSLKYLPPEIIGDAVSISGDNLILHDGIEVKKPNSSLVAIPESLDQFVDPVFAASQDAFLTLGAHHFAKSELCFIAQRTEVKPASASRPVFSNWHDHLSDRNSTLLIYQFSDALQTEFQTMDGQAVSGHNNGIIRMGSAVQHRSATNTSANTINRTWAALLVYERASRPSNTPFNNAFSESARHISLPSMSERPNAVKPFSPAVPILPQ